MLRVRRIAFALATILAVLCTVWAAAALYFDLPVSRLRMPVFVLYLIAILAALCFLRRSHLGLVIAFVGFAIVALWWFSLKPSNNQAWRLDNAETPYADVRGEQVTIHNLRNCDYHTETSYSCDWEIRSYDLASLRGIDVFITWWGSPLIAHPIVSFDFGNEGHIAVSIETRNVIGQGYSAIGGFFRQYTLAYIASDERDVIRLRTNYRKNEEVYLFRTTAKPLLARAIFLDYLERANSLHGSPEWYNALTNNCTTNIALSVAEVRDMRVRLDWRILLNGKMDEMMYENGELITGGLSFPELKEQAHINLAARSADDSLDFSKRIREGRVGFDDLIPHAAALKVAPFKCWPLAPPSCSRRVTVDKSASHYLSQTEIGGDNPCSRHLLSENPVSQEPRLVLITPVTNTLVQGGVFP